MFSLAKIKFKEKSNLHFSVCTKKLLDTKVIFFNLKVFSLIKNCFFGLAVLVIE
jgi:hypothetical protein